RRRHTRFSRDWSSDVCSSDLSEVDTNEGGNLPPLPAGPAGRAPDYTSSTEFGSDRERSMPSSSAARNDSSSDSRISIVLPSVPRSEERRVGEEWRSGVCGYHA